MATSPLADKALIELGKKLVANLNKTGEADILTTWMAHHIAELIRAAEAAEGTLDALAANSACMDAILKLWSHRAMLSNGSRPFESIEIAAQTLAKLAPDAPQHFYFQIQRMGAEESSGADALQEPDWLKYAEVVDETARSLIRFFIGLAVKDFKGELMEWLQLSKAVTDSAAAVDIPFVEALANSEILPTDDTEACAQAKEAGKMRKQLEMILKILDVLKLKPSPD